MNKRLKVFSLILVTIAMCYYLTSQIFKINYSQNNVVLIDSLRINDTIRVENVYAVLGKNHKGIIEATLFPSEEQRYKGRAVVEYYYLRFDPDWYKSHMSPRINQKFDNGEKLSSDLIKRAEKAHEDNFQYCCHINDYPIVNTGQLFVRISLLGVADKVTMLLNRK